MFGMSYEIMLKKHNPKYRNRFELLFKTDRKAFDTFVMGKNIELWKPLTDINVYLDIDNRDYKNLYQKRHNELVKWYKNFEKNFNNVLNDIEHRNPDVWNKEERKLVFKKYEKSKKLYERIFNLSL
jgi:hypothetical protein